MSTESHTGFCKQSRSAYYEKKAKFISQWRGYCRTCSGLGGKYDMFDPSAAGVSLSPGYMIEFEPCPDCLEKDACPRCGERGLDIDPDDRARCGHCSWTEENAESDFSGEYCLPPEPECLCFEDDIPDVYLENQDLYKDMEIDIANDPVRRQASEDADQALMNLLRDYDNEKEDDDV